MIKIMEFAHAPFWRGIFRLPFITFLMGMIGLSISPPVVHPAQVTLQWDAVSDPSPHGYKAYYGNSSGNYDFYIDAGNQTALTISGLQDGVTHYFAVTGYNTLGAESGFSNEVSYGSPGACTSSISPASLSAASSGGTGIVNVTAPSGCPWAAGSNASWIIITSNSSQTGNGAVNYSVSANSASTPRTGTMTIAGNVFTVNQSGASCSVTISPQSKSFSTSGGTGTIAVTAGAGCPWSASSNASWITVTSAGSGSGAGNVTFSVSSNSSKYSRTGILTVGGQKFTVTQSGRHRGW